MNLTVTFGWWTIPLIVTVVSFSWAIFTPAEPSSGGYFSLPDPMPLIRAVGALIVSLIAWLVWALLT